MKTFAIANTKDAPTSLWCSDDRISEKGRHFNVLNGGWDGIIKDESIYVKATKEYFKGVVVWEGVVPANISRNYNDAINYIDQQRGLIR